MKLAVIASLLIGLMAAGTLAARSHPVEWSPFLQKSIQRAEFANVSLTMEPSASDEVELTLVMGLPFGCYRPDVGVEHRDEFTHVLRPVLLEDSMHCIQPSSVDFQKINLGYLSEGTHKVFVENVEQPSEPLTFRVGDGSNDLNFEIGGWK